MQTLLDAIWNEHRSIASALHAMLYLVRERKEFARPVDTKVLRAILYYLDVFPERLHHPKEEKYLFAAVRGKTSEANAVLDELAHEHETGEQSIRELEQLLLRYEEGGEAEFKALAEAVERFVAAYREHMRKEEEGVMPVARRVLSASDWAAISVEWDAHRDPLAGIDAEKEFERVLDRIVELAPPPLGIAAREARRS